MDTELGFGSFNILLPNVSSSKFVIFEDLTTLFGVSCQSEAVGILNLELKKEHFKSKPSLDFESDYTQIYSKDFETIFTVAKIINRLCIPKYKVNLDDEELENIYRQLKEWKRPKSQKWKVGDILSVPMLDNSFTFGQIVGVYLKKSPILSLFDLAKKSKDVSIDELRKAKVVLVFNSDDESIKSYELEVLFNCELLAHPEQVRNKNKSAGVTLDTLANVYFGFLPWNVMYRDDYYDQFLLEGVERPKNILWLSEEERVRYRREHFNIDENNEYIKQ